MTTSFDAIVIGTGQAGPSLAARLAASGMKTAIIERKLFGGTCVNTGCTPTKALVASARTAHVARQAANWGVEISGDIKVDMKKVKARKDAIVNASTTGVENWLKGLENVTVYEGHGRFESQTTVRVGEELLEAPKIFINVGGRAFVPDNAKEGDVPYWTNTDMMEVDFVPEHLIVVGGSYIGLEFGQMFRRFGSKVTIIEKHDRIVSREDEDVSTALTEKLESEGIEFRTQAECISAKMDGDEIFVDVICKKGGPGVRGTHLLYAIGRSPNTHDLGLDKAGVKVNQRGFIEVDDQLKTSVEGIWAMGDCNGRGAFTHTAYNDYEIVAANLLDNDPRRVSDRILCYGLYTDPPLARIGMSETEALASGKRVLKGFREMKRIARAKERGETTGFMKVMVDADTEEILGATIYGIDGDEIIHSMLDLMYAKKPYTVISRAVHIHPTVSELIPTMLQGLRPLNF
ncbi:MAG: FAD-containing oxidoreductase [Roseivirga sp.]|nr:FAD-containing oxidoreductase [Roseivirga sp.]